MKALAEKLRGLEEALSEEKGPFNLFALFLREDAPDVWDLVVAAEWIEEDQSRALAELSKRVRAYLRPDEITRISRIVIVERTNPALKAIVSAKAIASDLLNRQGATEVANSTFFGLSIKHAFIITAQLNPPPNKVLQRRAASGSRR
jgi:hypothetical protein